MFLKQGEFLALTYKQCLKKISSYGNLVQLKYFLEKDYVLIVNEDKLDFT